MRGTLRIAVPSVARAGFIHPTGTEALLVEWHADLALVELRSPDNTLEGGAWFETLELPLDALEMKTVSPALDAETEHEKAQLFNRALWRLRKQFATLLIGSRYGHDDPLDPELDAVVRELVLQHDKTRINRCEWCGTRAPLKSVRDPHGADCLVDVCVWGCGDEP